MRVTVKLFALLGRHLPAGAENNEAVLEVDDDATPADLIQRLNLPIALCHLVLVNGAYLSPDERLNRPLKPDDVVAIWPPIAGG